MYNACWFYDQCRSKWGFDDGDATPPYAEEARELLVEAINRLLPENCPVEAYMFNRGGAHNSYLILWRDKGSTEEQDRHEPVEIGGILSALDDAYYLSEIMETKLEVAPEDERAHLLDNIAKELEE